MVASERESSARGIDLLTPEERLVRALGKVAPDEADRRAALAAIRDPRFAAERVVPVATAQRSAALLARNLEGAPDLLAALPPRVFRALAAARLVAARRLRLVAATAAPILADAAAAGIPLLLLKGAVLQSTVYPPDTRRINDVDVLIRREDLDAMIARFAAAGFRKVFFRGRSEGEIRRAHHEMGMHREVEGESVEVDLHWRLYPRLLEVDCVRERDLFERARPVDFGGARLPGTSPEDTLVHCATQLMADHCRIAHWRVADIHALARSGALRWPVVERIARESGAAGALRVALGLADAIGAEVPAAVLGRLEAACPGSATAAALLCDPRTPFGSAGLRAGAMFAATWLVLGRTRSRLRFALRLAFQPEPETPRSLAGLAASAALLLGLSIARAGGWSALAERIRGILYPLARDAS
jgi:hypothetical protein